MTPERLEELRKASEAYHQACLEKESIEHLRRQRSLFDPDDTSVIVSFRRFGEKECHQLFDPRELIVAAMVAAMDQTIEILEKEYEAL